MAKPVKQLRDLLQEKQEPFVLDRYLLEKGYLKKRFDSSNSLKSCDLGRSQKGSLQCPKVLKAVCNQVVSFNGKLGIESSYPGDWKSCEAEELERFCCGSASSSSCDSEETSTSQQKQHITVVADRKVQCQCVEESRELSPVSVLEEVPSNRDGMKNSSSRKKKKGTVASSDSPGKVTEDSILSASLWKILVQSARQKSALPAIPELEELVRCKPGLKSKKVLQQTRQLLFDCVGEIVETQQRKKKKHQQQQQREYFAAEDFGKLIEEKIGCWGKYYGEEINSTQLLEIDFRNSGEEWTSYKALRRRIGCEIGDAILEEMVYRIVIDMVCF